MGLPDGPRRVNDDRVMDCLQSTRGDAYRWAYALFEAVQTGDRAAAVEELGRAALDVAGRDWPEVGFVLAAARVVHDLTRPEGAVSLAGVTELVEMATRLGDPAQLAIALGLRGLSGSIQGDARRLIADASRAIALLDDPRSSPTDRSTGYVVAAAGLNTLRLWELEDELFGAALDAGEQADLPVQAAAIAVNRVLLRLEWMLALFEVGDDTVALHRAVQLQEAAANALQTPLPDMWLADVRACATIAVLLRGDDASTWADRVAADRAALVRAADVEVLPLLNAAEALALHRVGRTDEAAAAALVLHPSQSATSGAATFPLWVRATVLAEADPGPATDALRAHAALLGRLRWESRAAVLCAARAQIAAERRQVDHDRLSRAVLTDALTGLHNRRSFDDWLERVPDDQTSRTALLLVDLDGFKRVNDTYGHATGDHVLRRVGAILADSVRPGDLALRHGGDEFAVLLRDELLTRGTALQRARDLQAAIGREPWHELGVGLTLTASIGLAIAMWPGAGAAGGAPVGATALYTAADEALYAAKRGPDPVVLADGP